MKADIETFIDEVKTHIFWKGRIVARRKILKLYEYAIKLEKGIENTKNAALIEK